MTSRRAIVFGEVVVDLYPDGSRVVAGSPLHVAAHLAHKGWRSYLVTRVGRDDDGERVLEVVRRHGIGTAYVERDDELPTGRVTVATAGQENRFDIHRRAAWDAIEGPVILPDHDVLCYGTLAARFEISRSTMLRLVGASNARKVMDVNLRPPDVDPGVLRWGFEAAEAIKLSEAELAESSALLGLRPHADAYFASFPLLEWFCVTYGERGAALWSGSGDHVALEPPRSQVTNTIGAGDAFTAGLIDGLARGLPLDEVVGGAHACAVSVLAKPGGLPDPKVDRSGGVDDEALPGT